MLPFDGDGDGNGDGNQVLGLSKRAAELDCAQDENVRELVEITDALLEQKATRRNIFGERETLDETNEKVGGCVDFFCRVFLGFLPFPVAGP